MDYVSCIKLCLYVTFLLLSVVDVRILECNIYPKVITIQTCPTPFHC